ncbi:MAG: PQQ-dependent sugar dehydrogenase [Patescibacteria group bacterium]
MRPKIVIIGIVFLALLFSGIWAYDYFAIGKQNSFTNRSEPVDVADDPVRSDDASRDTVPITVENYVSDLDVPWDLVFTSPERALVSERPGRIRVIQDGELQKEPIHTFEEISSQAEEGLMGLVLDPNYAENTYLYACYAYPTNGGLADRVVRFTDVGNQLTEQTTILEGIPAARYHAGCRLAFGPDQKLYITTGDATKKQIAQDLDSLGGKILRLNPDGSIPADNPFPDSPIYSYGHRNPQGIDWHPPTGSMFSTEHGPSGFDGPAGGDEINIIQAGGNYGWPVVSHQESAEGMIDPLLVYTPAIAPGSGLFYTSDVLPQFTNNLFVGMLRGTGILRIVVDENDPQNVLLNEPLEMINYGRIRTVVEGPDGYIYFMTSNTDGRGDIRSGDDHIYRIVPR